jgi:hypothetical protein
MGVRRSQDDRMRLSGQVHIVDEHATAAQQARILFARDTLPDAKFSHIADIQVLVMKAPRPPHLKRGPGR